jgi:hypothetical protein
MKRLLIAILVFMDCGAILGGLIFFYQTYFPSPTATLATMTISALLAIALFAWAILLTSGLMLWSLIDRQDDTNRLLKHVVVNTRRETPGDRKPSGMAALLAQRDETEGRR